MTSTIQNLCEPWVDSNCKQYRWVLDHSEKPKHIKLLKKENFKESDRVRASLRDVFYFMHERLLGLLLNDDILVGSPTTHQEYLLLKSLRVEVVKKYDKCWKAKSIFAKILDLFLNLFKCPGSLTTMYNKLLVQIDARISMHHEHIGAAKYATHREINKIFKNFQQYGMTASPLQMPCHVFVTAVLKNEGKENFITQYHEIFTKGVVSFNDLAERVRKDASKFVESNTVMLAGTTVHVELVTIQKNKDNTFSWFKEYQYNDILSKNDENVKHVSNVGLNVTLQTLGRSLKKDVKPQYVKLSGTLVDDKGNFV